MALRHGADFTIDPIGERLQVSADQITDGLGYDVVIDASGSRHAVAGLLDIAAKGGTVLYGAMYPHDFEMPLNLTQYLYLKELTLTGIFLAPYAFPRALQILPSLALDELTAAVFPIDRRSGGVRRASQWSPPQGGHPLQRPCGRGADDEANA